MCITLNKAQSNSRYWFSLYRHCHYQTYSQKLVKSNFSHTHLYSLTSSAEHKLLFFWFLTTQPFNYPELAGVLPLFPLSHFRFGASEKLKSWDFLQISLALSSSRWAKTKTPPQLHFVRRHTHNLHFILPFCACTHHSLLSTVRFSVLRWGKSR